MYQALARRIGLIDTLEAVFPSFWQQIFMLACYLVSTGDPALYLEDWLSGTESLPVGSMASQRVSELLAGMQEHERRSFFQKWAAFRSEQEYLALDITSVSSYSSLIDAVEWGYNRDGEDLPQVNLCLLLGEKSRLPVYQTLYSGSLKDVSTLKATLGQACGITLDHLQLVMDKSFCSTGNIDAMLDDPNGARFIIALPFTMSFAKKQIQSERKDIDRIENAILVGPDLLRGVTKERAWNKDHSLYVHVYFNVTTATKKREDLIAYVTALRQQAMQDPENTQYKSEFDRYLIIRKSEKNSLGYTVNIREDVIQKILACAGWLVLVSNHVKDKQEAIEIYRDKDVVEKGFDCYKNRLDLNRFRVHGDNSMLNKSFVGYIALILMSAIHMAMNDQDMYRDRTMKQLIRTLDKQKLQTIDGNRILYPITKEQKDIYEKFGLDLPV
jgi:transposase